MATCEKEKDCPGWKWIRFYYPFWQYIEHCAYFRNNHCIMSEEEKQTAKQNLDLVETTPSYCFGK